MADLEKQLQQTKTLNDMAHQRFQEATALLDRLATVRAESDRAFVTAIDRWRDVESAVAALSEREQSAVDAINRASGLISEYSYNNQNDAEDLLRDARAAMRDGQTLTATDPLTSQTQFASAKSKAEKAYDEIDTSARRTRHTVSHDATDDDDDDSFFGGGGGGGSWGSGSDNDDSGGGGGWGGFGGPSGGDYGGPSGGDYGDGDF